MKDFIEKSHYQLEIVISYPVKSLQTTIGKTLHRKESDQSPKTSKTLEKSHFSQESHQLKAKPKILRAWLFDLVVSIRAGLVFGVLPAGKDAKPYPVQSFGYE